MKARSSRKAIKVDKKDGTIRGERTGGTRGKLSGSPRHRRTCMRTVDGLPFSIGEHGRIVGGFLDRVRQYVSRVCMGRVVS